MTDGPTIGSHRFEGQSLQTMYDWMHQQGNGPSSAETARGALVQLGTLLCDVESDMRTALRAAGIEWEGAAAAAAGQAIRQSAQWVGDAGRVSATSCRPAADQGEAFTTARSQIQQPHSAEYGFGDAMADGFNIATDVAIGPFNPFEVQTDVDRVAKQNAASHAAAVQAMTTWNSAAQTNLAALTPVDAPRPIAVQAAAATGAPQPVVGYGGSPAPFGPEGATGQAPVPQAPVTAQHLASGTATGPGPGAAPVSTVATGSGGAPVPLVPPAAAPPPGGLPGAGPGGRPPQRGIAVPGVGAGIGPAVTGGSDRPRSGPAARGGGPPAGRTGVSTTGRGGLPGGRGGGLAEGATVAGPGGMARPGTGTAGPAGAPEGAGRAGAPGGAGRGAGSFLHPAAAGGSGGSGSGGSGSGGSGDDEHQNRYWQKDSGIFEDNRLVAPPVIGEDPQQ